MTYFPALSHWKSRAVAQGDMESIVEGFGKQRTLRPHIDKYSTLTDWIVSDSAILKEGGPSGIRKQSPLLRIGA